MDEFQSELKKNQNISFTSLIEKYLTKDNYEKARKLAKEIGAMLWHSLQSLK